MVLDQALDRAARQCVVLDAAGDDAVLSAQIRSTRSGVFSSPTAGTGTPRSGDRPAGRSSRSAGPCLPWRRSRGSARTTPGSCRPPGPFRASASVRQLIVGDSEPTEIALARSMNKSLCIKNGKNWEEHGLGPGEDNDFMVRTQEDMTSMRTQTTQTMTGLLASIAGVSLIVGGIGIMLVGREHGIRTVCRTNLCEISTDSDL